MEKKKESKKKDGKFAGILSILILLVIGGVCGWFMGTYMDKMDIKKGDTGSVLLYMGAALIALYASMFVHIIVHEGGHLVFGLLTGYKFSSFRIGSFMWIKKDDKICLKKFSLAGTGGQCLMAPPDYTDKGYPFWLYNFGGCFANLLTAAVAFLITLIFPGAKLLGVILKAYALVGVVLALLNGIPIKGGSVNNDGSNAVSISKSKEAGRAFWIMMKINELQSQGVRVKDMPEEWFEMPEDAALKNSMVASIPVFKCNRMMDEMKFVEADKLMTELVNKDTAMPGVYKNLLINDMIYCELVGENKNERIEELLDNNQKKFMKTMKTFPSILRTGYAYLLIAKKDETEAGKVLELFEKMALKYPNQVDIEAEREIIQFATTGCESSNDII